MPSEISVSGGSNDTVFEVHEVGQFRKMGQMVQQYGLFRIEGTKSAVPALDKKTKEEIIFASDDVPTLVFAVGGSTFDPIIKDKEGLPLDREVALDIKHTGNNPLTVLPGKMLLRQGKFIIDLPTLDGSTRTPSIDPDSLVMNAHYTGFKPIIDGDVKGVIKIANKAADVGTFPAHEGASVEIKTHTADGATVRTFAKMDDSGWVIADASNRRPDKDIKLPGFFREVVSAEDLDKLRDSKKEKEPAKEEDAGKTKIDAKPFREWLQDVRANFSMYYGREPDYGVLRAMLNLNDNIKEGNADQHLLIEALQLGRGRKSLDSPILQDKDQRFLADKGSVKGLLIQLDAALREPNTLDANKRTIIGAEKEALTKSELVKVIKISQTIIFELNRMVLAQNVPVVALDDSDNADKGFSLKASRSDHYGMRPLSKAIDKFLGLGKESYKAEAEPKNFILDLKRIIDEALLQNKKVSNDPVQPGEGMHQRELIARQADPFAERGVA